MPAARGHSLDKVAAAVEAYVAAKAKAVDKGPLVMVEYILLGGCNDSDADAEALGDLLENRFAGRLMVNLIPYNPTPDLPYDRPTEGRARAFQAHSLSREDSTRFGSKAAADECSASKSTNLRSPRTFSTSWLPSTCSDE